MNRTYVIVVGLAMVFPLSAPKSAMEPPVRINVYGTHQGANVVYHYQVTNVLVDAGLTNFDLGRNPIVVDKSISQEDRSPNELSVMPIGWRHGREYSNGVEILLAPESTTQPPGWVPAISGREATPGYWLEWRKTDGNYPGILLGRTERFGVTLPQADQGFLDGHFSVTVRVSGKFSDYTGQIERLDTAAPTVSVALTPDTLWPANKKPVSVTATLTVTDNYDPQPQIKLESIVANEPLEKDDIRGARYGTDDRTFKLKAEREGKNKADRIYTVTYSATDASGNKATASATVTVPHDQRQDD